MPALNCILKHVNAQLQLRGLSSIILIDQSRIAAQLTKLRQFRQNRNLRRTEFLLGLFVQHQHQPLDMCVVQLLLLPGKLCHHRFLHLVRQIRQNILFQSPQDKRRNQFLQPFRRICISILHNRKL